MLILQDLIVLTAFWFLISAEREGFEPPDRSHGQWFSRPPHSTTLPSLPEWTAKIIALFLQTKKLPKIFQNILIPQIHKGLRN